jgi:hypothetical protein
MNNFDKVKITEILYENLKDKLDPNIQVDKLYKRYWFTGRSISNMRLTDEGKDAFDMLDLEFFEFHLDATTDRFPYLIINIGKKLKTPFWIGFKNRFYKSAYIRIYDSKTAMLINLYGSFKEYLSANKNDKTP